MSFDPEPRPSAPVASRPLWRRVLAWRPRPRSAAAAGTAPRRRWRWWLLIPIVPVLYYTIGMLVVHTIDDNLEFRPQSVAPGESRAVAAAVALATREVDQHRWVASDPFFLPAWPLDNMPNFQMGIMASVALHHRAEGPARPHARLQPDRPRPAGRCRHVPVPRRSLGMGSQHLDLAVGDLGAAIPCRLSRADRLQQAFGCRGCDVRPPCRQPAVHPRSFRQRPRLGVGALQQHVLERGGDLSTCGATTSSTRRRAASTASSSCCARSARTSRA